MHHLGSLSIVVIVVLAMKGSEAVTRRGVTCSVATSSSLPASVTDAQMDSSLGCAVSCLHGNVSVCTTNGFTMEWDSNKCIIDGTAGTGTTTTYGCVAST